MGELRKPLVLVNGKIQRLQPGDYLKEASNIVLQNDEGFDNLPFGTVCYLSGDGQVKKAIADNSDVAIKTIGLVADASDVIVGANANIMTEGVLTNTDSTAWDNAFGTSGGLVAGTTIYLSNTVAGKGVVTPPDLQSHYLVELGMAISVNSFLVNIQRPILL